MFGTIDRTELKRLLDTGGPCVLVNVLDRDSFNEEHICGSINIPVEDIETRAPGFIGKDEQVIVHCANTMCTASAVAAEKLGTMGYRNVKRFTGGIEEWKNAGYCLEGKALKKAA